MVLEIRLLAFCQMNTGRLKSKMNTRIRGGKELSRHNALWIVPR